MEHLLFEFLVRATLIAAGTAAMLLLFRVKMAAARHRAWAGVAVLMMLLPVWTAWGPKAPLRVLPAAPVAFVSRSAVPAGMVLYLPRLDAGAAVTRRPVWNWSLCLAGIYFLGAGILLARLAIGTVRAHTLVRRATHRDGRLTSDSCAAPVTVGWLTPTVILPECWRGWSEAQLDAVLTHEAEHARRRDPLVQWVALLNRAMFWFHPLAWWLERKLSALAEEACDAAVLARGHDRFEYSEYLLEMARCVLRTGARVKVLGMAMPGSSLPQRIRQILEGRQEPRISRVRMACMGVACLMVSAVFATGAVERRASAPRAVEPVVSSPAPRAAEVPAAAPAVRRLRQAVPTALADLQTAPVQAAPAEPQAKYKDRRMLVLYFDLSGMPAIDRARSFAAAQEFIRTKMQSGDVLAIVTANDEVKVKQDFTDDRNGLLQTLDRLMADSGPESGAADVDQQLIRLHTAVNMLAVLPGKKAVIYFAAETVRSDSAELRPLIDAAIGAKVAFYTVDSRGLVQGPPAAADKAYVIGAEDVLQISVLQQPAISGRYSIRPNGNISVVLVGDVRAVGLTTAQLEAVIADRLEANGILNQPSVTVSVVAHDGIK